MYVTFIDMKGSCVSGPVAMDRLPSVGEEVRLGDDMYVIQGNPVLNEPQAFPTGSHFVSVLTIAPKAKAPARKSRETLVRE